MKQEEPRDFDTIRSYDLLNVACISEILTGNNDYIRKGHLDNPKKIPRKYRRTILNLIEYVDAWLIEAEDIKNKK